MLFSRNASFGMDLVALNVQRGRDHGVPSYVNYRTLCNLSEINSFRALRRVVGRNVSI